MSISFEFPTPKVGLLIGAKGANINRLKTTYGVHIDVPKVPAYDWLCENSNDQAGPNYNYHNHRRSCKYRIMQTGCLKILFSFLIIVFISPCDGHDVLI